MKKIFTSVMLLFLIFCIFKEVKAYAASLPQVVADGAMLVDMDSGKVLYEKNADTKFYPASTTKIMTALLVLQHCKLDEKVIIGKNPSSFIDGNKIYLFEGEEFTVDQLLHALLIASANDVALAFAEHIAGSKEAFAEMMNQKAQELGCTNTHFTNPHGLDDPNHYTTARDLSIIAREAMKYDVFREIVKTISYKIPPTNKQPKERPLYTNNNILLNTKYHVDGANGIKVGYTDIARHSFVGSAFRGDTRLIVVLLHDKKPGMWEDASSLLNYGFNNFKTVKEVSKGDLIQNLDIANTETKLPLNAASDLYYTYSSQETPEITKNIVITNDFKNKITKGQKVGYVEYMDKGEKIGQVDLISGGDLTPTVLYTYAGLKENKINKALNSWVYIAIILLILFAALYIKARLLRRKKKIIRIANNKRIIKYIK